MPGPPTSVSLSGPAELVAGDDSLFTCEVETRGYNLSIITWRLDGQARTEDPSDHRTDSCDQEILAEQPEEEDGLTRMEVRLSDYLQAPGERELECEARLADPDISLTSETLHVKLVGQSTTN